jgi:hypothetical protein
MNNRTRAIDFVDRFVCGIAIQTADGGLMILSGSLVELRSRWFWITAAHCLAEFQKELDLNTVSKTSFIAYPGGRPMCLEAEIAGIEWLEVDRKLREDAIEYPDYHSVDPERAEVYINNFDLGLMQLPDAVILQLMNLGMKALPEHQADWINHYEEIVSSPEPKAFFVTGFPRFGVKRVEGAVVAALVQLMLDLPEEQPEDDIRRYPRRTFLPDWGETAIRSLKGMSGGPVILMNNKTPYLFGIQSSELTTTRVKALYPVDTLPFFRSLVGEIDNGSWILDKPGINAPLIAS